MPNLIKQRRDTTANWVLVNPILAEGEIGIEFRTNGSIGIKTGNGVDTWNDLPYLSGEGITVETQEVIDVINEDIGQRSINIKMLGAIGDGLSHPLSEKFNSLAEAQVVYPQAINITDEIDGLTILKALNEYDESFCPKGEYLTSNSIVIPEGKRLKLSKKAIIKPVSDINVVELGKSSNIEGGVILCSLSNFTKALIFVNGVNRIGSLSDVTFAKDLTLKGNVDITSMNNKGIHLYADGDNHSLAWLKFDNINIIQMGEAVTLETITPPSGMCWINSNIFSKIGISFCRQGISIKSGVVSAAISGNIFDFIFQTSSFSERALICNGAFNLFTSTIWDWNTASSLIAIEMESSATQNKNETTILRDQYLDNGIDNVFFSRRFVYTGTINIYVDPVNGNDVNSGSLTQPLKTIGNAISKIPKEFHNSIQINLQAGDYTVLEGTQLTIQDLYGFGSLLIKGVTSDKSLYKIPAIKLQRIYLGVLIQYLNVDGKGTNNGIDVRMSPNIEINNCTISNCIDAVYSYKANLELTSCDGVNNSVAYHAYHGKIGLATSTISAITKYSSTAGGIIIDEKISPMVKMSSSPASGTWGLGDVVENSNPIAGGYKCWICITAGTPGVWKGSGLIEV